MVVDLCDAKNVESAGEFTSESIAFSRELNDAHDCESAFLKS